jgi:hypothetical protein
MAKIAIEIESDRAILSLSVSQGEKERFVQQ